VEAVRADDELGGQGPLGAILVTDPDADDTTALDHRAEHARPLA
jgi:hypothetical protein